MNKWIPIKQRLPEQEDYYLVSIYYNAPENQTSYVDVMIAKFFVEKKQFQTYSDRDQDYYPILDVIAWQKVPEPYMEGFHEKHDEMGEKTK